MSAATLNIRWSEQNGSGILPVSFGCEIRSNRIGVLPREQRCPYCNSIVYSRRHNRCGVCEQVLPECVLFSSEEADKVNLLLRTERQHHKAWLLRIEDGRP